MFSQSAYVVSCIVNELTDYQHMIKINDPADGWVDGWMDGWMDENRINKEVNITPRPPCCARALSPAEDENKVFPQREASAAQCQVQINVCDIILRYTSKCRKTA